MTIQKYIHKKSAFWIIGTFKLESVFWSPTSFDAATLGWLVHPELLSKIISVCLHSGMIKNKDRQFENRLKLSEKKKIHCKKEEKLQKYLGWAAHLEIMELWKLRLQVFSGVIRAISSNKEFRSEYF